MSESFRGNRRDTYCFNCFNCLVSMNISNHFFCVHEIHSDLLGRSLAKEQPINIWELLKNRGVLVPWCFDYDSMGRPTKSLTESIQINFGQEV
jgi:hypothetical protein